MLLCMATPSHQSATSRPMTSGEALVALVIKAQEFRQLQDKMMSFRTIAPSVAVVLPVVAAIVECQVNMWQLQDLILHTRKTAGLM
jgi:ABC-type uncharacterized transport system permease subunit